MEKTLNRSAQYEGRMNALAVNASVYPGQATIYVNAVSPDTDRIECPFLYSDSSGNCANGIVAKVSVRGHDIAACAEHLGKAVEILVELYPETVTPRSIA